MSFIDSIKKQVITASLLLVSSFSGVAANTVTVKMDSAAVMMGELVNMEITVEQNRGTRGHFPLFKDVMQRGYVGVCGDSVEYRAPLHIDTVETGGKWIIKYDVPVQSFDSGYYKLPRIEFVTGVDTALSNSVMLRVMPVVGVTAETPISDYAGVADPENSSIFDTLPDWLVNYWWILLLIAALGGIAFYLWRKYRKEGHLLPRKPEPTPYESAISALKALREKKLWENGMEKEYFTELTDILRTYLYRRFGINAMEMTSRQILAALTANKETKEKRPIIRQILDMADFVKFAKVRPLPADNIASFDNALKFVEDTKPVERIEETQSAAQSGGNSPTLEDGVKQKGGEQ